MTTVRDIYHLLNQKAPFALQESWDNSGMLVGHWDAPVKRVFVALDICEETAKEAVSCGADLFVSHHPVIFRPAARITDDRTDNVGRTLLTLIENHIAAICCHTNYDSVYDGVNRILAERCGLHELEILEPAGEDEVGRPAGIGRVGMLAGPMKLGDYLIFLKQSLTLSGLRYVDGGKSVNRVAVGGGACGSMLKEVITHGCDTFVTSDLKYNDFIDAKEMGINLIDAGHFPTENPSVDRLADWVKTAFPEVEVTKSALHHEVFSYA